MRLRSWFDGVNVAGIECRVVRTKSDEKLRHARIAAELAEGLRCLAEAEGDPTKDHLARPASDVVRGDAEAAVDVFDRIRRRQRAQQPVGQLEAKHRECLVESLAQR